jgi:hypothetical protein
MRSAFKAFDVSACLSAAGSTASSSTATTGCDAAGEIRLLRLARSALGSLVPDVSYIGKPGSDFPRPFVGYPLVPGIPADSRLTGTARPLRTWEPP